MSRWPCEISAPVSAVVVEGAAETDVAGPLDELGDELVGDRVLDHQPGARGADLPGVQEHRGHRHVERSLAVGVGEDEVGVLAPELEGDLLHGAGPAGAFAADAADSPALDRGRPSDAFDAEPVPNGSFINLGATATPRRRPSG